MSDKVILLGMKIVLEWCVRHYRRVKVVKVNNIISTPKFRLYRAKELFARILSPWK